MLEAESKGVKTPAWRVCPEDMSDEKQRLLVRLHEHREQLAIVRKALVAINGWIKPIDNGRCAVCRIAFRPYDLKGKPQPCESPDCLSHLIGAALIALDKDTAAPEPAPEKSADEELQEKLDWDL